MMIYLQLYNLLGSHETAVLVVDSVGRDRRSCRLVYRRSNVKLKVDLCVKLVKSFQWIQIWGHTQQYQQIEAFEGYLPILSSKLE